MVNQSSKNIKVGAIITYITQFFSIGISLFYVPIMLGKLGQVEYGLYALVQSIISYLQMSEMGIGTTATRYNSKYIAQNDKDGQKSINGMFFVLYLLIALFCILVGGIIYFFLPSIYSTYSTESIVLIKKLFLIAMGNLLITFVFKIFNSIIISYERFIFIKVISLIQTILGPVGMLLVLYMGAGSVGMLFVTTFISLVFGMIQAIYCFSNLKISFDFKHFKKELFVTIFKFTSFVFLNSLANQLFSNTDKIIVSILMSETAVAIYAVVLQFDVYFYNFTNVISGFYLPKFTKMVVNDDNSGRQLMEQLVSTGRIQVIIAGLILGGFIAVGEQFVIRWVGIEYEIAYILTIVQFLTSYIGASQSMFNSLMQAKNLHKGRAIIGFATAALKVVFTVFFVKLWGLKGCVVAYLIVYIIRFIAYNVYYVKWAKMNIMHFWNEMLKIYLPITGIILGTFISFKAVEIYVDLNTYTLIIASALIYSLLYFTLSWFFVMNKSEKNVAISFFERFYRR